MIKPIIVVKVPYKLLYVCHSSERILNKMFNFLALLDTVQLNLNLKHVCG